MSLALPYQLTKTLLCAMLELQGTSKVDPYYFTNTTLNHKYNVLSENIPDEPPRIGYFGIGTRGFRNLDDDNLAAPYVPSSSNMDLYAPIPFRIVPVDKDLSAEERANYRMRVRKTVDKKDYWAYYLKKFVILDRKVRIIETDISTGEEVDLETLDSANLNPVPTHTSAEDSEAATHKISTAVTTSLLITGAEVLEAVSVLFGDNLLRANISEIGLYAGRETEVNLEDGSGGTFAGNELSLASLCYHYTSTGTSFANESRTESFALRINSASSFLL